MSQDFKPHYCSKCKAATLHRKVEKDGVVLWMCEDYRHQPPLIDWTNEDREFAELIGVEL